MNFSNRQKQIVRVITIVVACMALLLSAGLFHWLPKASATKALRPSLDILIIFSIAVFGPLLPVQKKSIMSVITGLIIVFFGLAVTLGIAQTVAVREFGYGFTLAYHMDKVVELFRMMYNAQSFVLFALCILLLFAAIILVMYGCARGFRHIYNVSASNRTNRHTLALGLAVYILLTGYFLGFNSPVAAEIGRQTVEVLFKDERLQARADKIRQQMRKRPKAPFGPKGHVALNPNAKRPDILVFVVESYGQILSEHEKYQGWNDTLAGYENSLQQNGFQMASRAYRPPVFGGSSWLANASLLCRYTIGTEKTFEALFVSDTPCLPLQLNEAGYHSVFAASNTTKIVPKYAARFPFQTYFPRDKLLYKGPRISWSYMPDQYVIDFVDRRVVSKPSDRPLFVYYKLTSSHHPWDAIPPYIEDWDTIGDGSVYEDVAMTRFPGNEFLGGTLYNEGYLSSVEYSMHTVVSYLNRLPKERDVLAIILGDHQPRSPVAEISTDSWSVPLHVVSRDEKLIEAFTELGFDRGLPTQTSSNVTPGFDSIATHWFRALNSNLQDSEDEEPR